MNVPQKMTGAMTTDEHPTRFIDCEVHTSLERHEAALRVEIAAASVGQVAFPAGIHEPQPDGRCRCGHPWLAAHEVAEPAGTECWACQHPSHGSRSNGSGCASCFCTQTEFVGGRPLVAEPAGGLDDDLLQRLATEGDPRFADTAGRAYIRIRTLQAALAKARPSPATPAPTTEEPKQ